jgi:hypothetical protein
MYVVNNAHHERLIHNLRKRRIPHIISSWIASFLQDRSTQLLGDLLDMAQMHQATGLCFIDNIVQGNADKENAREIKRILNEAEEWRKKRGVRFEISKCVLVRYTHNR